MAWTAWTINLEYWGVALNAVPRSTLLGSFWNEVYLYFTPDISADWSENSTILRNFGLEW